MSEISMHVVFDTEAKTFRLEGTESMPLDSDEYVWDLDTEEWRIPNEEEMDIAIDASATLTDLLRPIEYDGSEHVGHRGHWDANGSGDWHCSEHREPGCSCLAVYGDDE